MHNKHNYNMSHQFNGYLWKLFAINPIDESKHILSWPTQVLHSEG